MSDGRFSAQRMHPERQGTVTITSSGRIIYDNVNVDAMITYHVNQAAALLAACNQVAPTVVDAETVTRDIELREIEGPHG